MSRLTFLFDLTQSLEIVANSLLILSTSFHIFAQVIETLAKLHIIMEYATGGELFTKISNEGRLTEKEARPLYAQILAAVEHMVSAAKVQFSVFTNFPE